MRKYNWSVRESNRRGFLQAAGAAGALHLAGCTQLRPTDTISSEGKVIEVTPEDSLIDERITTTLAGFEPNEDVTVWAQVTDENNQTWSSFSRFETDDDGVLDLARHAPKAGMYEGIDPMGLLWSMRTEDNPDVPFIEDESFEVRFTVQQNGTTVSSANITRRTIAPDVTHERIEQDGLVGVLFEPTEEGPHPGVLVLHGSEGEASWMTGAMLASHGFTTFALQYFSPLGEAGLPRDLMGIPLEYCEKAIDWLLDHPSVGGDTVGVVGESKGGELALLVGSMFPTVGAVVGYVPSGVVWQGVTTDFSGEIRSSWTYEGEDLPFVSNNFGEESPREFLDFAIALLRGRPMALSWTYSEPVHSPDAAHVQAATIPVENINGPVLLISGEDDALWPSSSLSDIAIQRLDEHDHPYSYEHRSYENAGHLITVPGQPTTHFDAIEFMPQYTMKLGGTPAGNAHAAGDSWQRVLQFLAEGVQ